MIAHCIASSYHKNFLEFEQEVSTTKIFHLFTNLCYFPVDRSHKFAMHEFALIISVILICCDNSFVASFRSPRLYFQSYSTKGSLRLLVDDSVSNVAPNFPESEVKNVTLPFEGDNVKNKDNDVATVLQSRLNIFVDRIKSGDGFKQSLTDAIAGPDLDLDQENDKIDKLVSSSGCVMFSWTLSPFSSKAKKLLDNIGVYYKVIELDKPYNEGNLLRAALGRRVGRTSVPMIFINGQYIGGCEDGPSIESPGLIPLAMEGKLRPMLIEAGVLSPDEAVDFVPGNARRKLFTSFNKSNTTTSSSTLGTVGVTHNDDKLDNHHKNHNGGDDFECPSDNECEVA